jgi:hypothetical protein
VNRVRAGFFSITPPAPADDDGSYLRWHLLDHMPEQYSLPGLVHAQRWAADADLARHCLAAAEPLAEVGGVVNYLFGEPVQKTYDDFMALGGRLRDLGRFPEFRPSLQLRLLALRDWYAAPAAAVSAEVVPFRPHRGVLLLVEEPAGDDAAWDEWLAREHYPELLKAPGVAGVWRYTTSPEWVVLPTCEGGPQHTTVIYLDGDVAATTESLHAAVERRWETGAVRPVFAGPLGNPVQWDAWPT